MERKNIDELTVEIMEGEVGDSLDKAMSPRIANKLKYWFHKQGRRVRIWGQQNTGQMVAQKIEEAMALKELRKNQFMARVHSDGVVKMDFGSEIPQSIKKAAMDWAKRKGLKPVEASLAKADSSSSSVTYMPNSGQYSPSHGLLAQYVWEVS
jgi:hypothetical protein